MNILKSIKYKLIKVFIALIVAFLINSLFFFLSNGKIELIPIKWVYDNTNFFISLIALYISTYTYISIDKVSSISEMDGNPLEDSDYFGSLLSKISRFDDFNEEKFIGNLNRDFSYRIKNANNPYSFSNVLQHIIDSLVLYASMSNEQKSIKTFNGKDFKSNLMTLIEQKYYYVIAKHFVSSKSSKIMLNTIRLIEAILYYQQKNEYDDYVDFHLLIKINENYLMNSSTKVLYYDYYGLYHQRAAIQLIKKVLEIDANRLFTIEGIKGLKNDSYKIDAKDKFILLNKLEDAIKAFSEALIYSKKSDIWLGYIYLNQSRSMFLFNVISGVDNYDWLQFIDKAIDYRWRTNYQLQYLTYNRMIKQHRFSNMIHDSEYEKRLSKNETFLKKYYKYQESFAKLIKYNILIALNEEIRDSKGSLLCERSNYRNLDMDLPNIDNPKLSDFIKSIEQNIN